jgi:alkanesulfonate monooxygenase SsuD/methylene tetrahydromethanopterin reductase-like flavin-dependent oxidoreductase (luciferase family)
MASFGNLGIKQAARMALPLFTSPLESLPQLKERHALYQSIQEQARQSQSLFPLIRTVYVAETQKQARQDAEAPLLAQYRRYRRWRALSDVGSTFESITSERFIIGDPVHCAREIERYRNEVGVDYIVCRMTLPGLSHEKVLSSLRLFAREVMPGYIG